MIPASSSRLTRSATLGEDSFTLRASSAVVVRPFSTNDTLRFPLTPELDRSRLLMIGINSPLALVGEVETPTLIIEAAFKTKYRSATVYWQRLGRSAPAATDAVSFPIDRDEQFRRYEVNLSAAESYRGGITRIRFDPIPSGTEGDWVKVRSFGFRTRMQNSGERGID